MPRQLALLGADDVGFVDFEPISTGPGMLRLRSVYSAISHGTEQLLVAGQAPKFLRQWNAADRRFEPRSEAPAYPMALGYECVAEVIEVGVGADGWVCGDRLWLDAPHQDTHLIDAATVSSFQRIPPGVDPRRFAFLALTRVALGAVHDALPMVGDVAAVVGAGAIGQICLQLLRRAGVRRVFVMDRICERLDIAKQFGGIPINLSQDETLDEVRKGGTACDLAIEASGHYEGLDVALRSLAVAGRAIVVSSYGHRAPGASLGYEFHRNRLTLISSMTINDCPHPQHPRWNLERLNYEAAALLSAADVDVLPLITKVVPFDDAAQEYRAAQTNRGPKTLIAYGNV
jgi:threonine dehydrogenase-like Zn-dependent dehydrogenase